MSQSVAKNTLFMTGASVVQKIISFAYFTLVARSIGAEGTGKYFFALSFTTIFVVFVDLGLTNIFIREGAKGREYIQKYFSAILALKGIFSIVAYLAVLASITLMGYSAETRQLVYLSGITMIFDSFHLTGYGVLRALGRLRYEAIGIIMSQLLTLVLGSLFLMLRMPLVFLILAFTIPSAINLGYVFFIVYKKFHIIPMPRFDALTSQFLIPLAVPFALAAIFARLYSSADTILLSKLAGDTAVGWYSIPYKITFAFQFIPLALIAALYPKLSQYFVSNKERLVQLFILGMKYLFLVSLPIAIGIGILARDIIFLLYTPEYEPSVLPLQILIASLVFSFVSFSTGAMLNACNRQKIQTTILGFVMVANILLNVLLIPRLGITGAAIAAFIGNMLLAILGYIFVSKIAPLPHQKICFDFSKILIAGLAMGLVVFYMKTHVPLVLAVAIGVCVYPFCLFLTRALTHDHLKEAWGLVFLRRTM
ncbi:MAG: hypothetical protein A3G08_00065 [Candidatus Magasanikbacteria bacterium RIFCSPLOWO2_12_FULL_47_9b]|nr:MAG: hypothetical protein A3I74_00520 [Candidatus Magasanikbacteria bacterium RIFCSPLOWO2_02_FULL_47_16]OGH80065.1 MAG: hypothetical protein A3C10_02705 [Candidatus Magasanikbacteria bacterium RIFCSPHIGHO2_02_FULL_48_18]OGH82825.1 MAG: hypothetical protein A3G08_00065 [Candidatus Magasanikbacteria bacterium RIFCSPLOWO2_12_FULL_47_9b]